MSRVNNGRWARNEATLVGHILLNYIFKTKQVRALNNENHQGSQTKELYNY